MKEIEKKWYESKKFIAFAVVELLLAAIAVTALITQPGLGWPLAAFMVAIVLTMGAVVLGLIGKQALLDKYLRGMALQHINRNSAPAMGDCNAHSER